MKRVGNLYDRICDTDNLRLAFYKAARGKHDRPEVVAFERDFEKNIRRLHDQLTNKRPDLGHYRLFYVYDPKLRMICAASFPERVLHHAVMNVCEPALESYAVHDSYACRNGKGTHRAIARARQYARRYPWFLKLDIRKYFDSIDHGVLKALLARRFKDRDVLNLFAQIIDSYHTAPGRGLPIGNLVSQHLANFYLSGFDHWVKEVVRVPGYVRYMDDFILFGKEKGDLKIILSQVHTFLKDQLNIAIKDNFQLNRSVHGIPFLGFRIFSDKILLLPRSRNRFVEKFKAYENNCVSGKWTEAELSGHMEPLVDFTRMADSLGFRQNIINRFGVLS